MLDEQPAQNAGETYIKRRSTHYAKKNVVTSMAVVFIPLRQEYKRWGRGVTAPSPYSRPLRFPSRLR
jgi:hypothetical protein